ncbi:hypothetical protein KCP73_26125 [Salmonella enterica subsp. enterica]|nr:hypothetical protein KCP73_26125 [Salmonella enterica subsp. enterica]
MSVGVSVKMPLHHAGGSRHVAGESTDIITGSQLRQMVGKLNNTGNRGDKRRQSRLANHRRGFRYEPFYGFGRLILLLRSGGQ